MESAQPAHQPWETHRSTCGRARLTYHPEWSAERPWVSYINGTAGQHFAGLNGAKQELTRRGFRFGPDAAATAEALANKHDAHMPRFGWGASRAQVWRRQNNAAFGAHLDHEVD